MNYSRDMDWPWLEGDLSLLTGNCLAVVWGELKDGETSTIAVSTCRLPPPLILACEATSQKQDPVRNFLISWQVCLIEIYTHLVHRSKCRKRKSKLYRPLRPLMQPRSTRSVSKMCTNLWHIMKLQWHWRSALNGICVILAGRCFGCAWLWQRSSQWEAPPPHATSESCDNLQAWLLWSKLVRYCLIGFCVI